MTETERTKIWLDLHAKDKRVAHAAIAAVVSTAADDREFQRAVLLGREPDVFRPSDLRQDTPEIHRALITALGRSGDPRFIPLLLEALTGHPHFCDELLVRAALVGLGVDIDEEFPPEKLAVWSGSDGTLYLGPAEDFHPFASSICTTCRFFPCRVNRTIRRGIQNCKLWGQTDPDTLGELDDVRMTGSQVPADEAYRIASDAPARLAEAEASILARAHAQAISPACNALMAEEPMASPVAWSRLSDCFGSLGEPAMALAMLRQARRWKNLLPASRRAAPECALAFASLDEKIDTFVDRSTPWEISLIPTRLEKAGLWVHAWDHYVLELLHSGETWAHTWYNIGCCHRQLGELALAALALRQAVDLSQEDALTRLFTAELTQLLHASKGATDIGIDTDRRRAARVEVEEVDEGEEPGLGVADLDAGAELGERSRPTPDLEPPKAPVPAPRRETTVFCANCLRKSREVRLRRCQGCSRIFCTQCSPRVCIACHGQLHSLANPSGEGSIAATSTREVELKDTTGRVVAIARAGIRLAGHDDIVTAVAYGPEGSRVASAAKDGTVRVWDCATGKALLVLRGHEGSIEGVSFSPDGDHVASASTDFTVRIWDARTGRAQHVLKPGGRAWGVSYSQDGIYLATADDSAARVWNRRSNRQVTFFRGHSPSVFDVQHAPDGSLLASASGDCVRVWDALTGNEQLVLEGHEDEVHSLSFSPDGTRLASASSDRTVRIWDLRTGEALLVLDDHEASVKNVRYSPDGTRLASSSSTVRVWDAATGHCLAALPGALVVAWSPDGDALVFADEDDPTTLVMWTLTENAVRPGISRAKLVVRAPLERAAPRPSAASMWVPRLPDARGVCLGTLQNTPGDSRSVVVSADGRTLYTGDDDGGVHAWDLETGRRRWTGRERHLRSVTDLTISPDGTRLASASSDGTVRVWDCRDGEDQFFLFHHTDVNAVRYSPDGAYLASALRDRTVWLWDAHTEKPPLRIFDGHATEAFGVSFAPDGTHLASSSWDRTVRVWDVRSGEAVLVLDGHEDQVHCVSHAPDGTRLASGSWETVRIWDLPTGQALHVLAGHKRWVLDVKFSPDGALLASASEDRTIRIWHVNTGACLERFVAGDYVRQVAWAPSGAFLVSAQGDGVVHLWDTRSVMV